MRTPSRSGTGRRHRLLKAVLSLALVAGLVPAWTDPASAAPGPELFVDAAADNRPIDPRIYGINQGYPLGEDLGEAFSNYLDLGIHRSGGDSTSEYNWQLGAAGIAANWYYESFHDSPGDTPGDAIERAEAADRDVMLTLPVLGWVPSAPGHDINPAINNCAYPLDHPSPEYALQTGHDPELSPANNPNCGSGWYCPAGTTFAPIYDWGQPFDTGSPSSYGFGDGQCVNPDNSWTAEGPLRIEGNDPNLASICPGGARRAMRDDTYDCNAPAAFDGAWVQSLVTAHGTAANGGATMYSLDNEPDLWWNTHHQVHPECVTWDETARQGHRGGRRGQGCRPHGADRRSGHVELPRHARPARGSRTGPPGSATSPTRSTTRAPAGRSTARSSSAGT